jgi:5'-nucleotidase
MLRALESGAQARPLHPEGLALNVNFPDNMGGARWRLTRLGSDNGLKVRFVGDLGASASIGPERRSLPHLPGVAVEANNDSPRPDQQDDKSVANRRDITVSPMQLGYEEHRQAARDGLARRLSVLMPR